jgi:hypothetical protein
MRHVQVVLMLAVAAMTALTAAAEAGTFTPVFEPATPNAVTVTYDPGTGNLSYAGNGTLITVIELRSAGSLFIPENLTIWVSRGPFGVFTRNKFFDLITAGTHGADFGPVLPPGLSVDAILADITIDGSIKPAGKLWDAPGGGPYLFWVPEPTGLVLGCCGLLSLLGLRRGS